MAAAAAEIARPTSLARRLFEDMTIGKPRRLSRPIDARREVSHRADVVVDEAVAGVKIRRYALMGIQASSPETQTVGTLLVVRITRLP